MFADDITIERRYRDKATAHASGIIIGGTIGLVCMLFLLLLFLIFTTYEIAQCENNGGIVGNTLSGTTVCVAKDPANDGK